MHPSVRRAASVYRVVRSVTYDERLTRLGFPGFAWGNRDLIVAKDGIC